MAAILIKPQFEAGRLHIGKNGLVLSKKVPIVPDVAALVSEALSGKS